jgi:hypothetical protein
MYITRVRANREVLRVGRCKECYPCTCEPERRSESTPFFFSFFPCTCKECYLLYT